VIEHNGDVYSCDFFVEAARKLGNISDCRLIDILNSSQQKEFGLQKSMLSEKCTSCRWLKFCYGGCLKDRLNNPSDPSISVFCNSHKKFLNHADKSFQIMAEGYKRNLQSTKAQKVSLRQHKNIGRNKPCPCGSGKKHK
jgi:uncharacterized protein